MFEVEKSIYDLYKRDVDTKASLAAIVGLLEEHGVLDVEKFKAVKEETLKDERFRSQIKTIDAQISKLKEMEDNPYGTFMDALFKTNGEDIVSE